MAKKSKPKTSAFERIQSAGLLDLIFGAKSAALTASLAAQTGEARAADLGQVCALITEQLDRFIEGVEMELA